jgi:hypothetical protein
MSTPPPDTWTYSRGALLPSRTIAWYDGPEPNASLIDFSVPHTWALKVSRTQNGPNILAATKTTGITGAATFPNVTIDWLAGDLGSLPAGEFWVQLAATRTSDSKPRFLPRRVKLVIEDVVSS